MASSFPPSNGNNNGESQQPQQQQQMPSSQPNLALFVQQQQQKSAAGGGDTNTPPTISQNSLAALAAAEQQLQQQDLRALALQQQLAALMQQSSQQQSQQQYQQSGAQSAGGGTILPQSGISAFLPLGGNHQSAGSIQSTIGPQIGGGAAGGSTLLGFYQQLLALQQAQQQQQNSTPTVAALPQQFSTALHLQNSPSTSVFSQPPLGAVIGGGGGTLSTATPGQQQGSQGIQQAQHSAGGDAKLSGLLSGLLASNPALLHSILGQQQQQSSQNPLLAALSTHLLVPQQQQQAQQQPQQQAQLASILQLLNPNAATMYAYQSYLQQQVQQQPTTNAAQLQLLVQLLANNGGAGGSSGLQSILAALNSNQQQTLLAALAAQQQQHVQAQPTPPQPPLPPPPQDESRLLLEQLIRQNREQQQKLQQQQLGVSRSFPGAASIDPTQPSPSSTSTNAATAAAILAASLQQQQQQGDGGSQQQAQQQQYFVQQQEQHQQQETVADLIVQQLQQQAAQQAQHLAQQVATTPQQSNQQTQLPGQIHVQPIGFVGGGNDEMQQMGSSSGPLSAGSSAAAAQQQQSANRGTPTASERLFTSEAVQDRISRLISENEAIVEPNPVLLKRRPYQRQGTSNSMTSQTSENAGTSQRGSPGIRSPSIGNSSSSAGITPKMHPATTRSFSLHEASFLRFGGGSLTSGQPIINRQLQQQLQQQQLTCNFCQLKFPNEAGLEAHELRCSKKEMLLQKQQSQPQLKFAAAAASLVQQQQQFQLQQQLQQLQEHQSTIAALVGGGKGVARDLVINGNGGGENGGNNAASNGGGGRASELATTPKATQPAAGPSTSARVDSTQTTKQIGQLFSAAATQQIQQQSQPQPVLTMRDAIIFAITYSTDLRSTVKMPYFLTLTPAELDALAAGQGGDPTAMAGHFRGRTRNITSETFVCLNKVRPTPTEHRDNCSAYSISWSQPADCANGEAQLVQLFLNACNTSTRARLDPFSGEYTLAASRESVQLRTTHSSFWSQQQQKANRSSSCSLSPRQSGGNGDEPMDATNFGANNLAEQQTTQQDADQRNCFATNNCMAESDNDEMAMQNVVKME